MYNEEKDALLPWFVLRSVPGIGNHLFKRLTDRFDTPEAVLNAGEEELCRTGGISARLAAAIQRQEISDAVRRELEKIRRKNLRIVTMKDPDYPGLLLQIPDPPPFLYVYGNTGSCSRNIAVVGSRNPTAYGTMVTRKLCRELAGMELTVVSGMARGIDTAAHQGTLAAGGKTIAVLGSGFDRIYPAENTELFHRIADRGAVITEFPLNAGPDPHHFPIRNRIISGISLGVVVVEASGKSGSLITARLAAEQDREVFAVPGSISSFRSTGPHGLIKQGAKLVENAADIVEELPQLLRFHMSREHIRQEDILEKFPALTAEEEKLCKALGPYPLHIDELVRRLALEPGRVSALLLQLELKGVVSQSPGKMFALDVEQVFGKK
ncbi:MAG: DNA-processing protein DprA [Desulfococcaceae bacterium]|nr:DNA-processing protein DprA [Desulfococcaceae bacterium]